MVQCSGSSVEEGQDIAFLCQLQMPKCQTKKNSYPLPRIQEALESMDFKSSFWQVRMVPESQQYTTFTVGNLSFYEFTCIPFGLCNMPATFQHLMQNTLGELNLMYWIIYLDDVIVFGHTEEEHLECLCVIFKRFCKFNLKLKPSKCLFFQPEITYLAHHISRKETGPAMITCERWRSSPCLRPSHKSVPSADSLGIIADSLKALLTSCILCATCWEKR